MLQLNSRFSCNSIAPASSSTNSSERTTNVARPATLYSMLLRLPMAAIAGNVPDRSDVLSVAILGYN
jgi:hypothetical protein